MSAADRMPASKLTAADMLLLQEVQYFLAREAWLLDHEEFEQWLALLDPQIRYFAPVRSSVRRASAEIFDEEGQIAHFDDTIQTLSLRVKRLETGQAWAEDPLSRVRRFVSNTVLLGREGDELVIGSNVLIHREGADERPRMLFAYREDRLLRRQDGDLSITARTIWIDHLTVRPLTLFI
jgi:3-phenylpropionate/cinnamic acid dioxygenase small subunit